MGGKFGGMGEKEQKGGGRREGKGRWEDKGRRRGRRRMGCIVEKGKGRKKKRKMDR